MEWQGVNLTDFHQKQWQKKSIKNLTWLVLALSISILIAWVIHRVDFQKNRQNQPLVTQLAQLQTQQTQLEQRIEQLKNQAQTAQTQPISKAFLSNALRLLAAIPLKRGGIEHIAISYEQAMQIQISGLLTSEQEFEHLQRYLNQQTQFITQIDTFQTSHDGNIIFTLTIKEKNHED